MEWVMVLHEQYKDYIGEKQNELPWAQTEIYTL
jgi:hypothetical protein